jgi:hypothetical protein
LANHQTASVRARSLEAGGNLAFGHAAPASPQICTSTRRELFFPHPHDPHVIKKRYSAIICSDDQS